MPVMRKAPEKLFTKTIINKGYGFNTPQDGSVCKIKVTLDEENLLSGLDEDQCKEIIVGDVDEPVDCIIEDCIRTMKEEEECCIEFLHPDANVDSIIPIDSCDDIKNVNTSTPVDSSEDVKAAESDTNDANNLSGDSDNNPGSQSEVTSSDMEMDTVKEADQPENDDDASDNPTPDDAPPGNTEVMNIDEIDESCINTNQMVKIQFQLLSYTREPEIWEMSITEKWRRASYHKQRGLELYARGVYQYAFRRFGLTLKYVISLELDVPSGQEEGMDIKGLKLSCYLNVAACQMRHHNFESVVINSSKALDLQPNNAKALYRRGAAYLQLQEYEKAKEDLTAAQQLEPKNQAIAKQLQVLKSRVQKLNQYYASAMKKMFS